MTTMDQRQGSGAKARTLAVLLALVVLFYAGIILHHWFWPAR